MQHLKSLNKVVLSIIVLSIVIVSLAFGMTQPVSAISQDETLIVVKPGMSTGAIGNLLYERGLIQNVLMFRVIAQIQGAENSLQAGEYLFSPNMTIKSMLEKMVRGETAYRQLTIPEGFTVEQIAKLIEQQKMGNADKFKIAARNYSDAALSGYMEAKPGTIYITEGFLFPDTYRVPAGSTEADIVRILVSQFAEQFTPSMRNRAQELNLSIRDVIILASLVEKEARVDKDRPLIAGVFQNRLKLEMPLQSCATIQYILGYPKPELTVQDTEIPSPYNSYQHAGLPPGPIANPGLAAINAVLYPAETDFLYFVADKNGAHHFSKSYEEHLAAIEQVRN